MLSKYFTQYASKFGKHSSCHRTGKDQSSSQFPRRAILKNVQSTEKLHIFHASKVMLKILQARRQHYASQQISDVQAGFRKGRGIRDQIANIHFLAFIKKAREFQKNIYLCFIDYAKAFDCVDHNCGKLLKRWEYRPSFLSSVKLVCISRSNS